MPINIDWSQAEEGGDFEPLEPGEYKGTITKFKLSDKPGPSGFHYIECEWTLEGSKRKAWRNYSLSPKALWGLKQDLTKLGHDVPEGEMELDEAEMIGTTAVLTIGLVPHWDGKKDPATGQTVMVNEIADLKPADAFSWS